MTSDFISETISQAEQVCREAGFCQANGEVTNDDMRKFLEAS